MKRILFALGLFTLLLSCQNSSKGEGEWIKGTEEEKITLIESQFGGFGVIMMEVVYRYEELYWAGKDKNWDYAAHQLEEIQIALENGSLRRPAREESANAFLETVIPLMTMAIEKKDSTLFFQNFDRLRMECISCHIKEDHGYIRPTIPNLNKSLVRKE